jgi:hypothetical protein
VALEEDPATGVAIGGADEEPQPVLSTSTAGVNPPACDQNSSRSDVGEGDASREGVAAGS